MAIPDSSKVTLRGDVQRPLTYSEMDENFDQLKEVVDQSNRHTQSISDNFTQQKLQDRSLLKRQCAEAGLTLVSGSFEEGATVNLKTEVIWQQATGKVFAWFQDAVKTVTAGATPATSGGIGAGAWVDRTDLMLRNELAEEESQTIIAGLTAKQLRTIAEEGGVNVVAYGAKPYPFDSSSAFALAASEAQATRSPLVIPAGVWYTTPFAISLPHVSEYFLEKNCGVIGAGSSNTKIYIKGSYSGYAINLNYPVVTTTEISGFTVLPETAIVTGKHGLKLTNCAWFSLHDVVITKFDTGLETEDVLSGEIRNLYTRHNNNGAILKTIEDGDGYNTGPNALTFINCDFGSNNYFGLDITYPQVVNIIGGAVQGNGVALTQTTATNNSGGVVIRNPAREFSVNFQGVYFELNHGFADIYVSDNVTDTSALYDTTINTFGCMLFRQGNYLLWGVKHGVAIESLGNRKIRYNSFGDRFVGRSAGWPAVYANHNNTTYKDFGTVYSYDSANPHTSSTSGTIYKKARRTETIIINNVTTTPTYEGTVKLNYITKEGTGVVVINLSNIDLFRYAVTASSPDRNVSCAVFSSTTAKFTYHGVDGSTGSFVNPLHITMTPLYNDTPLFTVIG